MFPTLRKHLKYHLRRRRNDDQVAARERFQQWKLHRCYKISGSTSEYRHIEVSVGAHRPVDITRIRPIDKIGIGRRQVLQLGAVTSDTSDIATASAQRTCYTFLTASVIEASRTILELFGFGDRGASS